MTETQAKAQRNGDLLRQVFADAVKAVQPQCCLPRYMPPPCAGRTLLVCAGKAAAAMARVFEQNHPGPLQGIAVVPDGHEAECQRVKVMTAAHPVPDARSLEAAELALQQAEKLGPDDLLVCLLSGGASALLCRPADTLTLERKRSINHALLAAGVPIAEINCVRKHLSGIKGGRLALAARPARCYTLAISDVVGDDPAVIGSGPTQPDASTSAEALRILSDHKLDSADVSAWLRDAGSETPKPGDARLAGGTYHIIATGKDALAAAQASARRQGCDVESLGEGLTGDAFELGLAHARRVRELLAGSTKPSAPRLLVSGGETTVRVSGRGRGGRNTHYLLALAMALDGQPGVSAIACDTDGIDGCSEHAGAIYLPSMQKVWRARGMDPESHALDCDSAGFFAALDGLIKTGPTRTNVNDFRAILMLPEAWPA